MPFLKMMDVCRVFIFTDTYHEMIYVVLQFPAFLLGVDAEMLKEKLTR